MVIRIMNNSHQLDFSVIANLRKTGGNILLKRIFDIFLENAPKRVESALFGKDVGNLDMVERSVHSLKSSAANIGARSVQSLAEQIETLTESGQADKIGNLLQELSEVTDLTLKQIKKLRQEL